MVAMMNFAPFVVKSKVLFKINIWIPLRCIRATHFETRERFKERSG
jgi:hypothetical protein